MLLQERQLHRQDPLLRHQPRQATAPVRMGVLQTPPLDDERLGVPEHCRRMHARFSITIRQRASLRDLIEAIPEEDWTPIPYWMDGAADVAETTCRHARRSAGPTMRGCGS